MVVIVLSSLRFTSYAREWTPGFHEGIPCAKDPNRTIGVFIPKAYKSDGVGSPVLFLNSPGGNPDLRGYHQWAEENDVIMVAINSSRNGPRQNNIDAQEACRETLIGDLNMHPWLRLATGHSGGAQASWLMAMRHPDEFSGLLMTGQGGHRKLEPHINVAYIHGDSEQNNWYIEKQIKKLLRQKTNVRDKIVPGGHVPGPKALRIQMLDWLLVLAPLTHPKATRGDRVHAETKLLSNLEKIKVAEPSTDDVTYLESLLDIVYLRKSKKVWPTLRATWQETAFTQANGLEDPKAKHYKLMALSGNPLFKGSSHKKEIAATLKVLRKDPDMKREYSAYSIWVKLSKAAASKLTSSKKKSLIKSFKIFIARYKNTQACSEAEKILAYLENEK